MTLPHDPPPDFTRIPGLFRNWELPGLLQPDQSYVEAAGTDADGTPLLAIYVDTADLAPTKPDRAHDASVSLSNMGPILRQRELASRWRLSDRTLEAWRRKQRGPSFFRIGGKCFYALRDIEEFERRGRIDMRGPVRPAKGDRP